MGHPIIGDRCYSTRVSLRVSPSVRTRLSQQPDAGAAGAAGAADGGGCGGSGDGSRSGPSDSGGGGAADGQREPHQHVTESVAVGRVGPAYSIGAVAGTEDVAAQLPCVATAGIGPPRASPPRVAPLRAAPPCAAPTLLLWASAIAIPHPSSPDRTITVRADAEPPRFDLYRTSEAPTTK
jgi:hypothetical protein